MKKSLIAVLAVLVSVMTGNIFAQVVTDLDDLEYWGTGPNRTAFVVYWNDSKSPDGLAWGYQWSGSQTVADMLLFLAANDPRFFARIDSATGFGVGIFGLGYQTGSAPFGVTGAQDTSGNPVTPVFTSGIEDLNDNPTTTQAPFSSASAAPLNASDRYKEGWNDNGFWELYHSGISDSLLQPSYALPTSWTASVIGSGVALVDGAWAAFSISEPDFSSNPPSANVFAAIPEPGACGLLLLGAGMLYWRRASSRSK